MWFDFRQNYKNLLLYLQYISLIIKDVCELKNIFNGKQIFGQNMFGKMLLVDECYKSFLEIS